MSLLKQPVLLVLDNVSLDTAASALPFLGPRHPDSLVLATSWYASAFSDVSRVQSRAGHRPVTSFHTVSMAASLALQRSDAVDLIQQQIQLSRQAAGKPQVPADQLAALSDKAATALAFSSAPAYVPKVLSVCAWTLGRLFDRTDALASLLRELGSAQDPLGPGQMRPQPVDAVFGQLRCCFDRLSSAAQHMFIDLQLTGVQILFGGNVRNPDELALWLSCQQAADCTQEDATAEVRCMHSLAQASCP